jgi:hypothetical protein
MEELIKIASNGQWTLEKASQNDKQRELIERFLADKKAEVARRAEQADRPPEPKANPLEGLTPVSHLTGDNPDLSREQVARARGSLTATEAAAEAAAKKKRDIAASKRPAPTPISPTVKVQPSPRAEAAAAAATNPDNDKGIAEDIANTQRVQGRKDAWQATTEFLANKGQSSGMRSIAQAGQDRAMLDQKEKNKQIGIQPTAPGPKPKQELLPPQEPYVDEKTGQRGMREKQGTRPNEGHTTTGKIVDTNHFFKEKDPVTGEEKTRKVTRPQVQKHIWSWDHGEKKWNHVKTLLANPEIGKS